MTLLCASVHKRKEQKTEKDLIKDNLILGYHTARDKLMPPSSTHLEEVSPKSLM